MKLLSSEVRNLLDKLYNLRGEDSVILRKMNKERQDALATQERTKKEKTVLLAEIDKLNNEEKSLAEEGNRLMSVLSSIHKNDFAFVLDRLNIDFDPEVINAKVVKLLPETIDRVVLANKEATEKLQNVEQEMNNAITKIEELGIRKDEALSNQAKLNEFFDLALRGNINITRDEITSLLEKFDFSEDEQREAAKILMFPEDALYEYDASFKSGTINNNGSVPNFLAEAKKVTKITPLEDKTAKPNNESLKETVVSSEQNSVLTNIFDKVIEEQVVPSDLNVKVEETPENKENSLENIFNDLNININEFVPKNLEKLRKNYDEDTLRKNYDILVKNKIDFKVIRDNVELLYDKELKEKIDKLLTIGKETSDINLMPSVLIKYDLQGLNKTINVLQISGLDPKKVPLMAY